MPWRRRVNVYFRIEDVEKLVHTHTSFFKFLLLQRHSLCDFKTCKMYFSFFLLPHMHEFSLIINRLWMSSSYFRHTSFLPFRCSYTVLAVNPRMLTIEEKNLEDVGGERRRNCCCCKIEYTLRSIRAHIHILRGDFVWKEACDTKIWQAMSMFGGF